ncbi:MAG: gliding motility-associated C-terminal domain-containing protein [Flavobacteriales bacterium]|nr:gliding motility-associated C-terminal domain-containing protein [Flavobacteriales bacterium]
MAEHVRLFRVTRWMGALITRSLRTVLPAVAALMLWNSEAYATHAMGGDLTYECLGNNQYRVNLSFFRDCNGVAAPVSCNNGDLRFDVSSSQCGASFTGCFVFQSVDVVTPICTSAIDRCTSPAGVYGVERYRYSAVINLSAWNNCGTDWLIDWNLCCRNNAITSLNNPGGKDLYLSATLNNTIQPCNSSPRFLNDPIPFGCVGQPMVYNHGVSDLAGDSLVFSLAPARGAGGAILPYNAGYTFQQPVITSGGANAVQINSQTGTITFTPSVQQFSVVTVLVREYRNGVLIGSYTRDLQFAVVACNNNNPTASGINNTATFVYDVCANTNFCFDVNSLDADAGDVVTMSWNNAIPGATFTTTAGPLPTGTFCWTPTAANIGQQLFTVNVRDDACILNGSGTQGYLINITPPFTPSNAGPDQNVCGTSATLAGQQPWPSAQGTWSVISGAGTFASPNAPNAVVTGLAPGPNVLRWRVNYGSCGFADDTVIITAYDPNQPAANAGPQQTLCLPAASTTLSANTATSPAVGTWTLVNGGGTFANANSPTTTVSGLLQGTNTFRWTISNGPCGAPTNSTVTVLVYSDVQGAANAGVDQQLCSPTFNATLTGNTLIAPATGQWTLQGGSGIIANPNQRVTAVSGLGIGVNRFRWTILNGPCTPPTTQDEMTITVFDQNSPNANAGANQQLCATSTNLAGNAPTPPATGLWTLVSGTGTFTTPNSPTSAVTGLSLGTNVFQWTLYNGPCANGVTTSQVTVTRFDGNSPVPNAGPDQDLCTASGSTFASTTLAGNVMPSPALGTWTLVGGGGVITSPNNAASTVTNLPVGINTFRWTVANGPCTPTVNTDDVVIRVFDRTAPVANAGPDQEVCAPVTNVTLAGNAPTAPATGIWTVISGAGVFADASVRNTTVSGMLTGNNVYRWTISNGPCPNGITFDEVTIRLFDPATPAANAGPDQALCGSPSATLAANAVVFPATGTWTLISGTATIANASTATTSVSGLGIGSTVLRWTVNNGPCGTTNDEVTIVRFDPANPVANAGPDQSVCIPVGTNSVTLAGSNVISPATGTWSVINGSATIVNANNPNTQITDLVVGVVDLQWQVSNGPCPNGITQDIVRITVYDANTPVANAGPDLSICSVNGTVTMAGSNLVGPATGFWSLISGTGSITNPTSPTATITDLQVGQSVFQWNVSNGPCANPMTSDQMTITIFDPNNPNADAGVDQSLCTSIGNTVTLEGSGVTFPATGVWTVSGGTATIVSPNSPTTLATDLTVGTYTFTWSVNNGSCPNGSTSDNVIVIVADGAAQTAQAGPDQSVCGTASPITMAATPPTGGAIGTWSVVQGTATFSDVNSPTASVTGLSIGIVDIRWSIDNGPCGITSDLMTVLVFDPNNPVADAGPDQQLCTPITSAGLSGSAVTIPAVGQWTLVSGTGVITNPNSPFTTVSGLGLGQNIFQWQVNNGACPNPVTQDQVSLFLFDSGAAAATAGPDQQLCTPSSTVTMAGNLPVGSALGTWTRIGGTGNITAPNNPSTTVTNLDVGVSVYTWSINNGSCGTSVDTMVVEVYDELNPIADAGLDQEICTPGSSVNLSGSNVIFPATGEWTLINGIGTISNPNSQNTAVTGLPVGVHTFRWTVSNGPCANSLTTDDVQIFVYDENNPIADAGPDQDLCTPTTSTTLVGSPLIFPASGEWTVSGGTGVFGDANDPNTTVTGLTVGENIFTWTVSNGPCANGTTTDDVSIFLYDQNNPAADAGADQELCTTTPTISAVMAGSSVIFPAVGTWTLVSGSGFFTDANDPAAVANGLTVGENIFAWTVDNGPCVQSPSSDTVSIFVFDQNNPIANAGTDQSLCTPNTIADMAGSTVIFPASGLWTLVSGNGTITDPTSPTTTITDLGIGVNVFAWTVDNGPCNNGITTDEVSILLYDDDGPPTSAGQDQSFCLPTTSSTFAGNAVTIPAVGTWSRLSGAGDIADVNDPASAVTNLAVGENVFQWSTSNGPCLNGQGASTMSIFIFDDQNPIANAGPDQQLCTVDSASTTLSGSNVIFPAVGTWSIVSGSGTIDNVNDPLSGVYDLGVGVTVLEWTVDNGPCLPGVTTDQITISIYDENNPVANAGPDQDLCTPIAAVDLNGSSVIFPAVGTWTVIGGGGTITDPNDPITTITGLTPGIYNVVWSVDNGPCTNGITMDTLRIRLYDDANPDADAGQDQELCTAGGPTVTTNLQGSNVIFPAVGTWQVALGPPSIVIADINDPNTSVSGLAVGENILIWTVENGVCANSVTNDQVSIFVFDQNNPDADAGPDQQVCTPLTNAFMAGSSVTFPAVGTWTLTSGTGVFDDVNDPNSNVTGLSIGLNEFTWTVDNGACLNGITSSTVGITLFDAQAPPAAAGPDQEFCFPAGVANIAGNAPVGTAVGTWTVVQGGGTIADPNSPSTTVDDLPIGINILEWSLTGGACVTTRDSLEIRVFDPNNPPANAGMDQELCVPQDSVFMAGSALTSPALGTWTVLGGNGIPQQPGDPASLITNLSIGVNTIRWEVYNGPCGTTADTMIVILYDDTTASANAGPDLETCLGIPFTTMQGETPPAPAVGIWTQISGPSTGTFSDPTDPNSELSDLTAAGTHMFVWTLSWDPCPNNGILTDTVTVLVYDPAAPIADAGLDQTFCSPVDTTYMTALTPWDPGVGTWTVLAGTAVVDSINSPTSLITNLDVGIHTFLWTVYNGTCGTGPPTTDTISIYVYDVDAPLAAVGADQEFCTPTSTAILQANDATFPGVGTWTSSDPTLVFTDPNDPNTLVSGLGVGQHDLVWTIFNGPCGTSNDMVSIFIYDGTAEPANAGSDQNLCTPTTSTTLAASAPIFPASGSWTLLGGSAIIANATDPQTSVTAMGIGTTEFLWTIDNGPCGITTDTVVITIFNDQQPPANAGPDQQLCTPTPTVTLAGNPAPFPATGQWTILSGVGTLDDPSSSTATLGGFGEGVIVLEWMIDNGPCANGITRDTVVVEVFDGSSPVAAAGPDLDLCSTTLTGPITMFASSPTGLAFGTWSVQEGTGTFTDVNDPFTEVTNVGTGVNTFVWTVDNGVCGITTDQMTIFMYDGTIPDADAGLSGIFCDHEFTGTNLDASPVNDPLATGTWTIISGNATITEPTNSGTPISGLQLGDNVFQWTVSNGVCGTSSDTLSILLEDCLTLIIPDAFSPNVDGTNDVYVIRNLEYYDVRSLQVFNRWGSKVLDKSPYNNDWDGTSQFGGTFGEFLPESTYYYVLDIGGDKEPYTGYIYLRR